MCISAPFVCPKCSGFGFVWFDVYGARHGKEIPCPVCDGKLLIWPDGSDGFQAQVQEIKRTHTHRPATSDAFTAERVRKSKLCTICGCLVPRAGMQGHLALVHPPGGHDGTRAPPGPSPSGLMGSPLDSPRTLGIESR